MKFYFLFAFALYYTTAFSQQFLRAVVADSSSKKALPFATIKASNKQGGIFSGIDGRFTIDLHAGITHIIVSYVGYQSKKIALGVLKNNDTIFLCHADPSLKEFIVIPQNEKIRHIVNTAISNKPLNNPDQYDQYQCYIYYKMYADLLINPKTQKDSITTINAPGFSANQNIKKKMTAKDSIAIRNFITNNHMIFSETYSKRAYRKPKQLQEDVLASRFSGLKKTYFTFLVTDVLPFDVYGGYISLNGVDYLNPISKGWQQRYRFHLVDEVYNESDTVFILSFQPKKNTSFNSLKGVVFINSDGYAISNFIASTGDSTSDREAKIEQKYERADGKWFPKELNYDLVLKKYPSLQMGIRLNGHSVISDVSFNNQGVKFNKAKPVTLGDSVDLHTESQWLALRPDTLTLKEKNTYHVLDSISSKVKLEKKLVSAGKLVAGKYGIGNLDLDINRLFLYNKYEGTRIGLGLSSNEKISKYYSLAAWGGYGFNDSRWKYGTSLTVYPAGEKENWFRLSYQDNYQSAGDIYIHPELDNLGFRNWLLYKVDRVKEFAFTGSAHRGYWELQLHGKKQNLESFYDNNFEFLGKNLTNFNVTEAGIGIKYAYGERRIPMFGYYMPYSTQFPIVYFRLDAGNINSGNYSADYVRPVAAITYAKHFNRWGNDRFQLESGAILTANHQSLSKSFLLAGKGFNNNVFNYYAWGGFLTMHPYDYFNDRYVSLFYRHDFDKFLWQTTFSKPFISLAYNGMFGGLSNENQLANKGTTAPNHGYHETGVLLNQLLALNYLHVANIYINGGLFFHWAAPNIWNNNAVFVAGVSMGF